MTNAKTISALYKKIRADGESLVSYKDFKNIKEVIVDQYSDSAHFIFELIQNAEDAHATDVSFTLHSDELIIEHNGTPFSQNDVESICAVGHSVKKEENNKIGKFGVGFKSVYKYTNTPKIYSDSYLFCIKDLVLPYPLEENISLNGKTRIVLPFDRNDPKVNPVEEIGEKLKDLGSKNVLLFLKNITKIHVKSDDPVNGNITLLRKIVNKVTLAENVTAERISLTSTLFEAKEYYRFVHDNVSFADVDNKGNPIKKVTYLMIAYAINDNVIVPISKTEDVINSVFYVNFPTKIQTNLEYLIHAPFETKRARDSLVEKSAVNATLSDLIADLVLNSVEFMKTKSLLTNDIYNTIILNPSISNEYSRKIADQVWRGITEKIKNGDALLPTFDGKYASLSEVLIETSEKNSAEIKTLFTPQECAKNIPGIAPCRYWDQNYTTSKFRYFYNLLLTLFPNQKLSTRIKFGDIVDNLSVKWLRTKSNDELLSLYHIFYKQNKSSYYSKDEIFTGKTYHSGQEEVKLLQNLPLVRKKNGTLVSANSGIYLEDIDEYFIEDEFSKEFLKSILKVKQYDAKEAIKKTVLAKYVKQGGTKKQKDIPVEENNEDIRLLLSALESHQISSDDISDVCFIRGRKTPTSKVCFCSPGSLYLPSEFGGESYLSNLLSGIEGVYFVDQRYFNETDGFSADSFIRYFHIKCELAHYILGNSKLAAIQLGLTGRLVYAHNPADSSGYINPGVEIPLLEDIIYTLSLKKSIALIDFILKNKLPIKGLVKWSLSLTSATRGKNGENVLFSDLGYVLKNERWLYTKDQKKISPVKADFGNLDDSYKRPEYIEFLEQLGVSGISTEDTKKVVDIFGEEKGKVLAKLAKWSEEKLEELIKNDEASKPRNIMESIIFQNRDAMDRYDDDEFILPSSVSNPERRTAKLKNAFEKSVDDAKTHQRERVKYTLDPETIARLSPEDRVFLLTMKQQSMNKRLTFTDTESNQSERAFLEQEYKGCCQICATRIKKYRSTANEKFKYYYIARNMVQTKDLDIRFQNTEKIDGWNSLCLCPTCAAKYKYCSKDLSTLADQVLSMDVKKDESKLYEVKIILDGKEETIFYTPKHLLALQTAIRYFSSLDK